jgi:hypothetical protein
MFQFVKSLLRGKKSENRHEIPVQEPDPPADLCASGTATATASAAPTRAQTAPPDKPHKMDLLKAYLQSIVAPLSRQKIGSPS